MDHPPSNAEILRDPARGRVGHGRDPMVLRGSPYDDDAVDRQVSIDIPALGAALQPLGETFSVADAKQRPETRPLQADDRRAIIDQAILVMSDLYVHRYMKHTRHAVDPVVALRQLRRRCHALPPFEFHQEILRIFKGLRDIHTSYVLPRPYSDMVAFLPFLLGAYRIRPDGQDDPGARDPDEDGFDPALWRRVIVTGLLAEFQHPHFRPGAEILTWNGLPVQEAIRRVGAEEQGSNIHAQFELGLRLMTVRWFGGSLPPHEFFVTVAYRDLQGDIREIRFPWRVMLDVGHRNRVASVQAMWDLKQKYERQSADDPSVEQRSLIEDTVRERLYATPGVADDAERVHRRPIDLGVPKEVFETSLVTVESDEGDLQFGLVRIKNFVFGRKGFLKAFLKVLDAMPPSGMVIDIRSNPGGLVSAAESILQTLTPEDVTPLPFQFLATTLVEDLVTSSKSAARAKLRGWDQKVVTSIDVGNLFSRFGTLTSVEDANRIGQRYYGPVALITNAVTYSSGDIFAASFQDHAVGTVVGVDPTTGGGGANMWDHRDCVDMLEADGDLHFLPGGAVSGAKMHYAVRRCIRVGRNSGLAIEEEGVACDEAYDLTRDDLIEGDVDLLEYMSDILRRDRKPDFKVCLRCDGSPVDMAAVDIEVSTDSFEVEISAEIETNPDDGPVEHVLLVNGAPRYTERTGDGRARLSIQRPTTAPIGVRLDSYLVDQQGERATTPFARMKRTIRFV